MYMHKKKRGRKRKQKNQPAKGTPLSWCKHQYLPLSPNILHHQTTTFNQKQQLAQKKSRSIPKEQERHSKRGGNTEMIKERVLGITYLITEVSVSLSLVFLGIVLLI
ncbi:unnamed protein product [Lupinus luteus]|uniref:Uncharacterized protein n=1 Tax=Lupinus luteus TaxID=3873 RepID=A0AAV1WF15_LUPLU